MPDTSADYVELLLQGLVVAVFVNDDGELELTYSPHRRVILTVIDGALAFAEEDIPSC